MIAGHYYGKGKDELYDLEGDMKETENLIDEKRRTAHALLAYNKAAS